MNKKNVLVSACLLNEMCRYDGTTKMDIYDDLEGYEIIPVCPERFMGIPRPKIFLCSEGGKLSVIREDGMDVTQVLEEEIDEFIASCPRLDKIILKSKSPSCGFKTTPVRHGNELKSENGLLVHKLLEIYDESIFFDEINYKKELRC
jgi:uncharacterized protein YbbK (DUF523 family)